MSLRQVEAIFIQTLNRNVFFNGLLDFFVKPPGEAAILLNVWKTANILSAKPTGGGDRSIFL